MFKKLIFKILLLLSLFTVLLIYGWEYLRIDEGIQQFITQKLKNALGNQIQVKNIRMGFGGLHLEGVQLAFNDAPYDLHISDVQLGYSLKSLFKSRFNPERLANEITFYHPRLTINYSTKIGETPDLDLALKLSEADNKNTEQIFRSILKEYDFIKRITISEGEILLLETTSGKRTQFASKINGWAYTDDRGRAWMRLAGHIFQTDEYNMILYGQANLKKGAFDLLNIDLHDYKIGNEIPFLLPDYFKVLDGVLNGHLVITEKLDPARHFNIEGNLNLHNGRVKLVSENIFIDQINFDAEIKDWTLFIKQSSQIINGSLTTLKGKIINLLDPRLELQLSSNSVDIQKFLSEFSPEKFLPIEGNAQVTLDIQNSILKPEIQGNIDASAIRIFNSPIQNVHTGLAFRNRILTIQNFNAKWGASQLVGSGEVQFEPPNKYVNFHIRGEGDITDGLKSLGLTPAAPCEEKLDIKIFGPYESLASRGSVDLKFLYKANQSYALKGTFGYSKNQLFFNAHSDENDFQFSTSVQNLFGEPTISVSATNFENAFLYINQPILTFLRKNYNLNFSLEKSPKEVNVKIEGFRRNDYAKLFEIGATTDLNNTRTIEGDLILFPNSPDKKHGDFLIKIGEDSINLDQLVIENQVEGRLSFSKDYLPQNGSLTISGISLFRLLALLGKEAKDIDGKVFGKITVAADTLGPVLNGDLWVMNAFLRKYGPLNGEIKFVANSEKVVLNKFNFDKLDKPFIRADGEYDLHSKEINGLIGAKIDDVNDLIYIITSKDDIAHGKALVQVQLKGKPPEIPLFGRVDITDGQILKFKFDHAMFEFGEESQPNGSYFSLDALKINNLIIQRDQQFTLYGNALFPFNSKKSLNASLEGDGNFLVFLSDLDEFFEGTSSEGHLMLKISGKYERPNFTGSKFSFKNGLLKLSSVTKRVENLSGDFVIHPEDYFLEIKKLTGTIHKKYVKITNQKSLSTLEPLRVAGDDLNLGILRLETPEGVFINIPGLMEKGEMGWFKFVGRKPGEYFTIAGPWDRPYVRGEIVVKNANLTFPFVETGETKNSIAQKIINSINWDVYARSEKDTRYVRQFPTAIYVNMVIDNKTSGLDFKGVLKDSTFSIAGKLESTSGTFEYFDLTFRVEKFEAEFNRGSLYPIVSGKAWTVLRDSTSVPYDVYLTLYTVDELTNQEVTRGRWDRLKIKVSSDFFGLHETEADILKSLGYASETMDKQARRAVGYSTDNLLFRPIIRPLERRLERTLGLDVIRFSYAFAQNFLDASFDNEQIKSTLSYLRSSRLIIGKYLTSDLYFNYTGELEAGIEYKFQDKGVGLHHKLGLEYRFNPRWLIQMEYDYNTLFNQQKDDKKIWLRYSFPF